MPGQIRPSSSHPRQRLTNLLIGRGSHTSQVKSTASSTTSFTSRTSHSQHSKVKPPADMFIIKALEKILGDRDIKKSYNSQLKKACEDAMSKFAIVVCM